MKDRIIFHVDVNSAYLSWEAVERQKNGEEGVDLRRIPSVVGGEVKKRRGVVLAKSIPTKKYNVITGEPIQKALQKCPQLVIVRPNHDMYEEYSNKLIGALRGYTNIVEQFSIDESFMDVSKIVSRKEAKNLAIKMCSLFLIIKL